MPHSQDVGNVSNPWGNCLPVHGGFNYDSPKVEMAQGQSRGKDICSRSGLLFTNEKKLLIIAITRITLKNIMLTETHQTQKSTYDMIHLNEILEQEKLIVGGKKSEQWLRSNGEKVKDYLGWGMRKLFWSGDSYLDAFVKTPSVHT